MKFLMLIIFFSLVGNNFSQEIWNFEGTAEGGLPEGWRLVSGTWSVAEVGDDMNQNQAIHQSGSETYNMVVFDNFEAADIDIEVNVFAVSGSGDQGGGLVWRVQDDNNYYVSRYNPLEGNIDVRRMVDGSRQKFGSVNVTNVDGWNTLRYVMTGDDIIIYYNGEIVIEATDNFFPSAGKIGLWTKADANTYFDDLTDNLAIETSIKNPELFQNMSENFFLSVINNRVINNLSNRYKSWDVYDVRGTLVWRSGINTEGKPSLLANTSDHQFYIIKPDRF